MKVKRGDLVSMFVEMGFDSADEWDTQRLQKKLVALPGLISKDFELEDEDLDNLMKDLIEAVESDEDLEILESPAAEKPKKKPAAKRDDAIEDEDDDDFDEADDEDDDEFEDDEDDDDDLDDDDFEDDDEDEEEAKEEKKPAPKKGVKAEAEPKKEKKKGKRPGIIATIDVIIEKATQEEPVTKKDIIRELVKQFPDRDPTGMSSTVNTQVPSAVRKRGLNVHQTQDGEFYIGVGEPVDPVRKKGPKPGSKRKKKEAPAATKDVAKVETTVAPAAKKAPAEIVVHDMALTMDALAMDHAAVAEASQEAISIPGLPGSWRVKQVVLERVCN